VIELLQHHRAVEQKERVVSADLLRQILLALDVERLVQCFQRAVWITSIERGARGQGFVGMAGAARLRERDEPHDACGVRELHRRQISALVTDVLYWNKMALVSTSST
jgi:hypothetical protein